MIYFSNDYLKGAHPKILEAIMRTNDEPLTGYGSDEYCDSAKEKIRIACNKPNAEIYFLTGGTQTNSIVINSLLNSYEGVIAADTGHISIHEAGAIEFTGHKVIEIPHVYGKIDIEKVSKYMINYENDLSKEHRVHPAMLYISQPTEYGTLYTKEELIKIYNMCKKHKLLLYIDGARLGYGLVAEENDVTMEEIANLCDVFYIGGTKIGAMFGEAVVFSNIKAPSKMISIIKQEGGLLAKGRYLGIQFDTLFTDNLYYTASENAIKHAKSLKEILSEKNYKFYIDSPTNQQFVIMNNDKVEELSKNVNFSVWDTYDENSKIVRFVTSWATTDEDIKELEKYL